jgi:hypothetical protein
MQRRELVAKAGAVTVTAFAATLAFGATFGLAGRAEPDSPVGRFDDRKAAVTATSQPAPVVSDSTPHLGPEADD